VAVANATGNELFPEKVEKKLEKFEKSNFFHISVLFAASNS
jgi:hypothetical protein